MVQDESTVVVADTSTTHGEGLARDDRLPFAVDMDTVGSARFDAAAAALVAT